MSMKKSLAILLVVTTARLGFAAALPPALTIYNQNFAAVRDRVTLDLKAGVNNVNYAGVTAQLEPDSVVLRDPLGRNALQILEQSYRADTISTGLMLLLNEGNTITFLVKDKDAKEFPVKGKIIRSGFTRGATGGQAQSPIIEVDGQLRFSLPGEPIFPALADDAILKPTLAWKIEADAAAKFDAELGYITSGFSWQAAYNIVAPEKSDTMDMVGWVTINNQSGKTFDEAVVKLMAGDVNRVQPVPLAARAGAAGGGGGRGGGAPVVTERTFDEFHLYSLVRPVTLRDRETKQVEFLRATGAKSQVLYVYEGAAVGNFRTLPTAQLRQPDYGTQSNTKVWVMREFKNTKENGLGLPLPKGRVRFYRKDETDQRIEFIGENNIDHTPQGELVRLYTGDSFDLVGERKRSDYQLSSRNDQMDESFEIKLRNRKTEPVEIRVVERLYRWVNWEILQKSDAFTKTDAQTIEFRVQLKPDEEKIVTYRVRYNWQ